MSAARVDVDGKVYQLDSRRPRAVTPTAADVKDHEKLARLLADTMEQAHAADRRANPRRIDFEDKAVTATTTTKIPLEHNFGTRVRWWVVGWDASAAGTAPALDEDSDTDENTLVLVSGVAGTVTIRVEEAL